MGLHATGVSEEEEGLLPEGVDQARYAQVWRRAAAGVPGEYVLYIAVGNRDSVPLRLLHLNCPHTCLLIAAIHCISSTQVRNRLLARWRGDVSRFLSEKEALAGLPRQDKALGLAAYRFLHGG